MLPDRDFSSPAKGFEFIRNGLRMFADAKIQSHMTITEIAAILEDVADMFMNFDRLTPDDFQTLQSIAYDFEHMFEEPRMGELKIKTIERSFKDNRS